MQTVHDIEGSFENADDLLWQAVSGRLPQAGGIHVRKSGRIGPLVELTMARRFLPDAYRAVTFEARFVGMVDHALNEGTITGNGINDVAGVFPLFRHDPRSSDQSFWDQWAKHAENAAVARNIPRRLVEGLVGAMGELQDNVYTHSGGIDSGLVAYAVSDDAFEFVVADAGMGVLASLKQNPEFTQLEHSGQALREAISDGASRFGRQSGHGYGISQLFRALAHENGDLRFRSGDHVLTLSGDNLSPSGKLSVVKKANLPGFIISVRYNIARGPNKLNRL